MQSKGYQGFVPWLEVETSFLPPYSSFTTTTTSPSQNHFSIQSRPQVCDVTISLSHSPNAATAEAGVLCVAPRLAVIHATEFINGDPFQVQSKKPRTTSLLVILGKTMEMSGGRVPTAKRMSLFKVEENVPPSRGLNFTLFDSTVLMEDEGSGLIEAIPRSNPSRVLEK